MKEGFEENDISAILGNLEKLMLNTSSSAAPRSKRPTIDTDQEGQTPSGLFDTSPSNTVWFNGILFYRRWSCSKTLTRS